MDSERYNPLDIENLGESVTEALLKSTPQLLGSISGFEGAGIYAIYYVGAFPCYEPIASVNRRNRFERPIYVGKAVPAGARKGGKSSNVGNPLFKRLCEHAESIKAVTNLDLDDFFCRYLVVDDIWIPLGESLLIARFSPIWNTLIDGFGNHDPGSGRYNGMQPRWDVLHPGRKWAAKCRPRPESPKQIETEIVNYLTGAPFVDASKSIDMGENGAK